MFCNFLLCLLNNLMLLDGTATATTTDAVAGNKEVFSESMDLMQKVTGLGGGLWALWGIVVLAGGLKDKNGPALQSGIWQIAGGGLIIVAAALFKKVVSF